ncbi:MAG: O-antigen ligase family protein [Planctomycetota bacterium]
MSEPGARHGPSAASAVSDLALGLALALLATTFFLISPPPGQTYPGAIPWRDWSLLRPLTQVLSVSGQVATARGVEVKDLMLHIAAALGLGLLGLKLLAERRLEQRADSAGARAQPAVYAQLLLGGWVVLSLASALWSSDPRPALGQGFIYAFHLGWAVALAHTFRARDLSKLLSGVLIISAAGAALCLWYYYERNPYHRPGFPLGNPNVMSAAMLPAVLISVGLLAAAAAAWRRGERPALAPVGLALVALVPLVWSLKLTQGRGALVALVAGLAAMGVFLLSRRARWLLAMALAVALTAGGAWYFYESRLDVTMARGATIRFRLYAWRYAAELWQQRAIAGHGAGAYPRLAGELAVTDMSLDPAAFMAELVEHAHNELFEILTEIGLVGGVTFVGGFVATLFAASAALRSAGNRREWWLILALFGGVAALLADSLTGSSLRLPGVPAIFFTLLGALWAVSMAARPQTSAAVRPPGWLLAWRTRVTRPAALAVISFAGAAVLALVTVQNWRGVRHEQAASVAAGADHMRAVAGFSAAEGLLLDPVRVVVARRRELDGRLALAHEAAEAWAAARQELAARQEPRPPGGHPGSAGASPSQPAKVATETPRSQPEEALPGPPGTQAAGGFGPLELWEAAARAAIEAYEEAVRLSRAVPSLTRSDASAAQAAELLAELHAARDAQQAGDAQRASASQHAGEWAYAAGQHWYRQRFRTPYDVETLLALTRYPGTLSGHVELLRDALRFGEPYGPWLEALVRVAHVPGFEAALSACAAAAGPMTPETGLDLLILSMAPETHRLVAACHALRGEFAAAADEAATAAALYAPMRPRFPEQHSRALAEQALYLMRDSVANAARAVELVRAAIAALPLIQEQKYEEMVAPFRRRLVAFLIAAGRVDEARVALAGGSEPNGAVNVRLAATYVALAEMYVRVPPERRPPVEDWLRAALRLAPAEVRAWSWLAWLAGQRGDVAEIRTVLAQAAAAGVSADQVEAIRRSLGQEYPALRAELGP